MSDEKQNPRTKADAPKLTAEQVEQALDQLSPAQVERLLTARASGLALSGDMKDLLEKALLAIITQQSEDLALKKEQKERAERIAAECQKTAWERTQEIANREYKGQQRFNVCIPKDKIHVQPITIAANSREEAQARYDKLCGIRHTEHDHIVTAA